MLEFMRALEAQALWIYQDKCFGSYEAIERGRIKTINILTARLQPDYPHIHISIEIHGLRLRVIGDASALRNDGFYCQFRLHPADGFRARHIATLSVMDFAGAGIIANNVSHFRLSRALKI
jgi:hypothetical protein